MQQQVEARRSASWAAILLPLLAVGAAAACFADGLVVGGTGHAPILTYLLPLVISPVLAALFAVAAALVRRGRVYWLSTGYLLVAGSLATGLVAANAAKHGSGL
ncbi:hypothetical protein KDL01_06055 [Actinospica durhamensis]|uniref:Uncharacterized protein n=1 Tax=Actinospica durhamensis TaxID=1508375 RepID=A0A941ILB6_9ACTN|nr:hypothetical protein [Actinospica durhamensis]MBR7832815.1 hypothetical protein [Actinospica durhamensis]